MNILVVGATGDVGSAAAKIAVNKGHKVRALVRNTSNRDKLGEAKDRIGFVEGDMLDKASLERALEGMEGVIIAIRLTEGEQKKGRTYQDVELNGAKNVVEAARKKGVKKIVHVSASGVGPQCVSDMYRAKHQSEEAIKNVRDRLYHLPAIRDVQGFCVLPHPHRDKNGRDQQVAGPDPLSHEPALPY